MSTIEHTNIERSTYQLDEHGAISGCLYEGCKELRLPETFEQFYERTEATRKREAQLTWEFNRAYEKNHSNGK